MIRVIHVYVYQRFSSNRVKVYRSPWAIYQRVTASMKSIKTQTEPNPSYFFPRGALGKRSSVTAPTLSSVASLADAMRDSSQVTFPPFYKGILSDPKTTFKKLNSISFIFLQIRQVSRHANRTHPQDENRI